MIDEGSISVKNSATECTIKLLVLKYQCLDVQVRSRKGSKWEEYRDNMKTEGVRFTARYRVQQSRPA